MGEHEKEQMFRELLEWAELATPEQKERSKELTRNFTYKRLSYRQKKELQEVR